VSVNVTTGFGSQLSMAVALPIMLRLSQVLQVAVRLGGQVMAGGKLSLPRLPAL
jgi:hypothetical protein